MASQEALLKEIADLKKQVQDLEAKLKPAAAVPAPQRTKVVEMSAEVRDDNPYSRLMALKKMGIVKNYEQIRNFSVAVVGLGGIGSVVSDMLTRCGIGKLLLFDFDTVTIANMNRLFFTPEQVGMSKVEASKETLSKINPDVAFETYSYNITTVDNFDDFVKRINSGSVDSTKPVDLVLSCVDNFEARMTVNQACNESNINWMESGVSEDAVSGHIQVMIPGKTACYQCAPPLVVASGVKQVKREGVCAASLPTTMGIIAGFLVQNVLKFLLKFGETSYYLGYSAMKDFFPKMIVRPNPSCGNKYCLERQATYQAYLKANNIKDELVPEEEKVEEAVVPSSNEWGIEIVDTSAAEDSIQNAAEAKLQKLAEGIEYAYVRSSEVAPKIEDSDLVDKKVVEEKNLADLMSELNDVLQ